MANLFQRLFGLNEETTIERVGGLPAGLAMARERAEQQGDAESVQAIDNGTYKELLERRSANRKASVAPDIDTYSYNIAGINFRRSIADYVGHTTGYLKPQPANRHDPNAIAVYAEDGHHIGYIPATETYEVHSLRLLFPIPVSVDIEECYDYDESRRFFVGSVKFLVKRKNRKI